MATNHDTLTTRARIPRRQFLRGGLILTGSLGWAVVSCLGVQLL